MSIFLITIATILGLTSTIAYFIYWIEDDKPTHKVVELDEKLSNLRKIKFIIIGDGILSLSIIFLNNKYNSNFLIDWIAIPLCTISAVLSALYLIVYFITKKLN